MAVVTGERVPVEHPLRGQGHFSPTDWHMRDLLRGRVCPAYRNTHDNLGAVRLEAGMGETIEAGGDDTGPARGARFKLPRANPSVRREDKPFRFTPRRTEAQVPRPGRGVS